MPSEEEHDSKNSNNSQPNGSGHPVSWDIDNNRNNRRDGEPWAVNLPQRSAGEEQACMRMCNHLHTVPDISTHETSVTHRSCDFEWRWAKFVQTEARSPVLGRAAFPCSRTTAPLFLDSLGPAPGPAHAAALDNR